MRRRSSDRTDIKILLQLSQLAFVLTDNRDVMVVGNQELNDGDRLSVRAQNNDIHECFWFKSNEQ